MTDALAQVGAAFLAVSALGIIMSSVGIWMTRAADRKEAAPELSEMEVAHVRAGEE